MWKKYLFIFWSWNLSQKEQKKAAAEKKAALAAMLQTQEVSQKAKETVTSVSPSESGQQHSKRKLPVGASVSSVNVDYEYFEVGTGQVRLRKFKQTVWNNTILLLVFMCFFIHSVLMTLGYVPWLLCTCYVYEKLYLLVRVSAGRVRQITEKHY